MSKVLSAVFGIGIAVVVYVTMLLGIQAFYPEPEWADFCEELPISLPVSEACPEGVDAPECRVNTDQKTIMDENVAVKSCQKAYDEESKNYSRNFFLIASLLGLLAILASYFLLNVKSMNITNISAGVASSGIVMILWAFMRSWDSTDEKLKFGVGLVITLIVVFLAVRLNMRHVRK